MGEAKMQGVAVDRYGARGASAGVGGAGEALAVAGAGSRAGAVVVVGVVTDGQAVLRPLPFDPPVLLAPMEGLTSAAFRLVIEPLGGLGAVYTEFVSESAAASRKVARREVVKGTGPLIVQLLGNDPERLEASTRCMVDAGADGIDLNVGCPSSCVTRGSRGAALLKDPDRLEVLLSAIVSAAGGRVPVSAKIRAGWDDPSGIERVARAVERAGCAFLTVHGRTFAQGYSGEAQLAYVERARAAVEIPVVANGDLVHASQAAAILDAGRADGVMIGRGAVRNPWIFAQLAALRRGEEPARPTARDLADMLRRFIAAFSARFDRSRAVLSKLKEIVGFLSPAIHDGGVFRDAVRHAQELAVAEAAIEALLAPLPDAQVALDARGPEGTARA